MTIKAFINAVKYEKWCRVMTILMRLVVGAVFVFSGFAKAVDPWGAAYKVTDYLNAWGMDGWTGIALFIAVSLAALEFLLGIAIVVGAYRRSAPLLALLLMLVLTPVTLWLAVTDAVPDCGCFGDAWHLSNWATFFKNVLLLLIALPALVSMNSSAPFGWVDAIAAILMLGFIVYETVADEQQWKFQSKKWEMINGGKKLEELPVPYNKGFNTTGLWSMSRHPNYMAEQAIWVSLYIFSIGAGVGIINWSMIGALLLIVLFVASSSLSEGISGDKYPEYGRYCKEVNKFLPGKRYKY